jgi:YVTN family beta-propeller protein
VRTIAVGVNPGAVAVDSRHGRVFVLNIGTIDQSGSPQDSGSVSVVDTRRGTVLRTLPVGLDPVALAVDERSGDAVVVNGGGTVANDDLWAQVPGWLRHWLPFLPQPGAATTQPGSLSIVDPAG